MGFFGLSWRLPAALAGMVVTALLVCAPRIAQAQSVAIGPNIRRKTAFRADPVGRLKVSRADCLADDVFAFPLSVGNYAGSTLEVWATQSTSDDCRVATTRTSNSATCWRVYQAVPNAATLTVPIRVQDFVARPAGVDGTNVGTSASCVSQTSTGQPVALWFMFLQGTSQVGTAQTWPTTVDLLGPSPPKVEDIQPPGNGLIKLSWAANTDPDVVAYRIFCEDMGAAGGSVTTYEAGTPGPEGGSTCSDVGSGNDTVARSGNGTADDAGDATDGVTGDAPDDAGDATDGVTGDAPDDAGDAIDGAGSGIVDAGCTPGTGGGGTGASGVCGGSIFARGQMLTPEQIAKYSCGTATGQRATSAFVTNLINGTTYAVAVAASDLVENVGVLSDVQCGTPQPVNGFDEAYRSAGGKAGGTSFCSLGLRSGAARARLWPGVMFLAIGLIWRSRRRPRRGSGASSR